MTSEILISRDQYYVLCTIRAVEKVLLDWFDKGLLRGTTHTCLGQEAIAVAAMAALAPGDIVTSGHRAHGHFLAYGGSVDSLLLEMTGHRDGVSHGLGGSQHLHLRDFYTNGIQGGMVPVAAGMAMAEKIKGTGRVALCFLGDGSLGEGIVYETFNMAALWDIPIIFAIENNGIAQSTPIRNNMAGSIAARAQAFGIDTQCVDGNDLVTLLPIFAETVSAARKLSRPFCLVLDTWRAGPHSKGDDWRSIAEITAGKARDPLPRARTAVAQADTIQAEAEAYVQAAADRVLALPQASFVVDADMERLNFPYDKKDALLREGTGETVLQRLNRALHDMFDEDSSLHLIGEDLLDPYGGAFKVSKGMSTKFPDRVHSTPISEAGFTGIANGMALRGLRPIVEIMFGDFTTLVFDQILNHMVKFRRMYGTEGHGAPVIIRTPMGGRRGYGPTHSQSLEKFFLGIPGLLIIACDPIHDQGIIWRRILATKEPCLYIENKHLYGHRLEAVNVNNQLGGFHVSSSNSLFPTTSLRLTAFETPCDAVLVTYGGMVPMALKAAMALFVEEEWSVTVVVPSQIAPLPMADLLVALGKTRVVVTLEEGSCRNGWGAEIGAFLAEQNWPGLKFRRCAAVDTIIPSSSAGEEFVLPDEQACIAAIKDLLHAA